MARVLEIRGEAFADDVEVTDEMCNWTEEKLIQWFESGGDAAADLSKPVASKEHVDAPLCALPPDRQLRVLSLHGGGGNKTINTMQMMRLKKAMGPRADFQFLEGTREWLTENIDPGLIRMFGKDATYLGW